MLAIAKREISAYFNSFIGYIYLTVFMAFAGLYFFATTLLPNSTSLNYVFSNLLIVVVFLMPILTMRLFSEDRKQKTDQALLTAPVNLFSVVMGKYISAILLYLISISVTLIFALVICFFTQPNWAVIIGNFVGLFLLGAAFISIGMFISSTTESQVISAIVSVAVSVFIILLDSIASLVHVQFIAKAIKLISLTAHYNNFTMGIFNITDVIFFLSVCTIFIFLTIRVFEKRRWS